MNCQKRVVNSLFNTTSELIANNDPEPTVLCFYLSLAQPLWDGWLYLYKAQFNYTSTIVR